jgi:hypothetical protein
MSWGHIFMAVRWRAPVPRQYSMAAAPSASFLSQKRSSGWKTSQQEAEPANTWRASIMRRVVGWLKTLRNIDGQSKRRVRWDMGGGPSASALKPARRAAPCKWPPRQGPQPAAFAWARRRAVAAQRACRSLWPGWRESTQARLEAAEGAVQHDSCSQRQALCCLSPPRPCRKLCPFLIGEGKCLLRSSCAHGEELHTRETSATNF